MPTYLGWRGGSAVLSVRPWNPLCIAETPKMTGKPLSHVYQLFMHFFFSLIDILSGGIFFFDNNCWNKKCLNLLYFWLGLGGPLFFFFLYIFFFNDTLFAPLNFYSDFYSLITGLICAWVLWITDIILMDKKDIIMPIIGQLNKHARIQEVESEGVQLWRFFCFLFLVWWGEEGSKYHY